MEDRVEGYYLDDSIWVMVDDKVIVSRDRNGEVTVHSESVSHLKKAAMLLLQQVEPHMIAHIARRLPKVYK